MDTTSNAASRLLHLLATYPDVQTRLRNEILEVYSGEALPYDQLMELPFLDAVCRETLRLWVSYPHYTIPSPSLIPLSVLQVPSSPVCLQRVRTTFAPYM